MICPRSRRMKSISCTTIATILIDEMDKATPRKSAVANLCSTWGIKVSGRKKASETLHAKGITMPVSDMAIAGPPTLRISRTSVSIPVRSNSSNTPNWRCHPA